MSASPISRSPDLQRLADEGYEVAVHGGWLRVDHVPYVDSSKKVRYGVLVAQLNLVGDVAAGPASHVAYFAGETPCDAEGRALTKIINGTRAHDHGDGLITNHLFSSKPLGTGRYPDYYELVTSYVAMLAGPAQAIDPSATARTGTIIEPDGDSPFRYADTATSRAGIEAATHKLRLDRVAIVGLGGSGSYILDLVAKTPVREIHLFDGDLLLQHNAFRSPGAAALDDLSRRLKKVEYFAEVYSRMRDGIVAHPAFIDESSVEQLHGMEFVFLALDDGASKEVVVAKLDEWHVPFIDVGMGIAEDEGAIGGILRVTASTPAMPALGRNRIPLGKGGEHDDYAHNVQIADLNAFNAALAVIKWKKLCGFYRDLEGEHFSAYTLDGNHLLNEDQG